MNIKKYIIPEYITSDFAKNSTYSSVKNAYDRNDLSIIANGYFWYTENCPTRIQNTVYREMKRLYPHLTYLWDL